MQVSEETDLMAQVLEKRDSARSQKHVQIVLSTNRETKHQWHDLNEDLPHKRTYLNDETKELYELLDLVETRLFSSRHEMLNLVHS